MGQGEASSPVRASPHRVGETCTRLLDPELVVNSKNFETTYKCLSAGEWILSSMFTPRKTTKCEDK